MKIAAMIIGMMLATLAASAQGYKVNPNSSVTFSIKAPEATEVKLEGSVADGGIALAKNADGLWTATTDSLAPDLYYYWFTVDGVKTLDPLNPYVVRDIASLFNIFILPGEESADYAVRDVPHGEVSLVWYHSAGIGCNRRATIYMPAQYRSEPERRFPVLYLLHGMGGDETAWEGLGRTSTIMDNLIADGKAEPMIVVMPNGNVEQAAAPGATAEGMYITDMKRSCGTPLLFERSFSDLVGFVDANYRTIADKQHRAIAGLSMGGGHVWRIGLEHPDLFNYYGLFSAAIGWNGTDLEPFSSTDDALRRQLASHPELYWIAIGTDDFLFTLNQEFRKQLDSLDLDYTYFESAGGHSWSNWRLYLKLFAPKLFK